MKQGQTVKERIRQKLAEFSVISGKAKQAVTDDQNLIKDLGFTSLEGVEFVLELCDEFAFDFSSRFNPFVDDDGRKGRSFGELVQAVETQLDADGGSNGKE